MRTDDVKEWSDNGRKENCEDKDKKSIRMDNERELKTKTKQGNAEMWIGIRRTQR